jgi:hypothetical protein
MSQTITGNTPALLQIRSEDGSCAASIIESGGLFRFVEERELWEPPSSGLEGYHYWSETKRSGLYASAKEAAAAANAELDWLPEPLTLPGG